MSARSMKANGRTPARPSLNMCLIQNGVLPSKVVRWKEVPHQRSLTSWQQFSSFSTSTYNNPRTPLPYESVQPARLKEHSASRTDARILPPYPEDAFGDQIDFGTGQQLQDLAPPFKPLKDILIETRARSQDPLKREHQATSNPIETTEPTTPESRPVTDLKPSSRTQVIRAPKQARKTLEKAMFPRTAIAIQPPRAEQNVVSYQDSDSGLNAATKKSEDTSRSIEEQRHVKMDVRKEKGGSTVLPISPHKPENLYDPSNLMYSRRETLALRAARANGFPVPAGLALERKPYYTEDDRRVRAAMQQFYLTYGDHESPECIEEIAGVAKAKRSLAQQLVPQWLLCERRQQRNATWHALYAKDAEPFIKIVDSLNVISHEIALLYNDQDMTRLRIYIKDLQQDVQSHLQAVTIRMHIYGMMIRYEANAFRLKNRGHINKLGDLWDAYKLSIYCLGHPYENVKTSCSELFNAGRALDSFRTDMIGHSDRGMARKPREKQRLLYLVLVRIIKQGIKMVDARSESAEATFCDIFANAAERTKARQRKKSSSRLKNAITNLIDLQTREGILHSIISGDEESVSLREVVGSGCRVVRDPCEELHGLLSEYEKTMLLHRQGPGILTQIQSFYEPDFEDFIMQSSKDAQMYGAALLQELWQSRSFESQVDMLLSLVKLDMLGVNQPCPIIRQFDAAPKTLVDQDTHSRPPGDAGKEAGWAAILSLRAIELSMGMTMRHIDNEVFGHPRQLSKSSAPSGHQIAVAPGKHAPETPDTALQKCGEDDAPLAHDVPASPRYAQLGDAKVGSTRTPNVAPASPRIQERASTPIMLAQTERPHALRSRSLTSSTMASIPAQSKEASRKPLPRTSSEGLNLQQAHKLLYPNLSLSSFSAQRDPLHSMNVSLMAPDGERIDDVKSQAESTPTSSSEPFRTPLGFHIPDEKMRAARDDPRPQTRYWQHSLYQGPNGPQDTVKVHYCKNKDAMETVSRLFEHESVLGFDIEWMAQSNAKDGIRRNVSLIQIASESRIALFHLAIFPGAILPGDYVAPTFKKIMESRFVAKAGVAIKGDSTRLRNHLGVHCQGLFELSHLYKLLRYHNGQQVKMDRLCVNLAQQVHEHLGLPLLKGRVQTSNWSRDLDWKQTQYAASDSYAGFQLYHCMEAQRLALDPVPPRPAFAELNQSISVAEEQEQAAAMFDGDSEDSEGSFISISDSKSSDDMKSIVNGLAGVRLAQSTTSSAPAPAPATAQLPRHSGNLNSSNSNPELRSSVPPSKKLDMANAWASSRKALLPARSEISAANLRAYHLWHHQRYDVPEIAAILRNPPLKTETVIGYISDVVWRGPFPAEPERFATMGSHGMQPHNQWHKSMLLAAARETERRRLSDSEAAANVGTDIGWWNI